jgi:regulator of RNase E activity RraA
MIRQAGPGDVLVVQMDGAAVSTFGGLAARAAAHRRIEGAIVDGGCRDLDEIRALDFRVCSRHVTPVSGKERVEIVAMDQPIVCGGIRIHPMDYIVADETGAIAIPAARFPEILAVARDLAARDEAFARALDDGQEFGGVAASLGHA